MLSAQGCRQRRQRFRQQLDAALQGGPLLLGDPLHMMYLANFWVDPFSLSAAFGGYLRLEPDGRAILFHDNRLAKSVEQTHADELRVVPWYDGQSPGHGPRRLALREAVSPGGPFVVHDAPQSETGPAVIRTLAQ